jgi:hypothetical protein
MARIPYVEANDHPELSELASNPPSGKKVTHGTLCQQPRLKRLASFFNRGPGTPNCREFTRIVIFRCGDQRRAHEYKSHVACAAAGITQQQADALANWRK